MSPKKLAQLRVDLITIEMDLIPSQAMANAITTELTTGRNKVPSYAPFVIPQLDEEPWCDPSSDRKNALARRQENSRHENRSGAPPPIPFQAWCLYNIRFLITGELCGAWLSFGGLAAQLSHFAIVLNLATTENILLPFRMAAWCAPKSRNARALGVNAGLMPPLPSLWTF